MNDFDMLPTACPYCGYKMDSSTNTTGEEAPKPGDISLCLRCAGTLQFQDDMTLVEADAPEEIKEQLDHLQTAIWMTHARVGRRPGG